MFTDTDGGRPHRISREAVIGGDPLVCSAAMRRRGRRHSPCLRRRAGQRFDAEIAIGPVRLVSRPSEKPDHLLIQPTRASQRSGSTAGTGAYLFNLKDNKQTAVATVPLTGAWLRGRNTRWLWLPA